jgi:hypothetical protein
MVPLFQSAEEAPGDQKWCPSCCRTGWQIQQQQCGAKENGSSIGSAAVPAAVRLGSSAVDCSHCRVGPMGTGPTCSGSSTLQSTAEDALPPRWPSARMARRERTRRPRGRHAFPHINTTPGQFFLWNLSVTAVTSVTGPGRSRTKLAKPVNWTGYTGYRQVTPVWPGHVTAVKKNPTPGSCMTG